MCIRDRRIGTISPDGRVITWTQMGVTITSIIRLDINECGPEWAVDPCAAQYGTFCYNTDPGYTCNCDVSTDGGAGWSFTDDVTGNEILIHVTIDSSTQPKATVTYTMSDGTASEGVLYGNTIEFMNADGSIKIGNITKHADGISASITWNDGSTWWKLAYDSGVPGDPAD